jgi:hypothetical protein
MARPPRPIPLQTAQHRKLSLGVYEGIDGYRLAFAAEARWAPVDDPRSPSLMTLHFARADDAWRARAAALHAARMLDAVFKTARK